MLKGDKIKVLLAKPGLDGHDIGVKIVAKALSDAGMEVIYTGLFQTPEQIVKAAIQEDVDMIGLSFLSQLQKVVFPKVIELLKQNNANDIKIFGGGIIPKSDISVLKDMGVGEVFLPGTPCDEIVNKVKELG